MKISERYYNNRWKRIGWFAVAWVTVMIGHGLLTDMSGKEGLWYTAALVALMPVTAIYTVFDGLIWSLHVLHRPRDLVHNKNSSLEMGLNKKENR